MAIGDNFDTTPPGYTNQTTGRKSGHGVISQYPGHYSDDNKTHPCNAGCGCKMACNEGTLLDPTATCALPPELTIHVTKAYKRDAARAKIVNVKQGFPDPDVEVVHLVYSYGAWRGRKCCQFDADGNELCDPCDVTTDKDGNKTDCSYGGQEGATRNPTGPPGRTTRNDPYKPDDPSRNCVRDGDVPPSFGYCYSAWDVSFNNLFSDVGFEKCSSGFCTDGAGNVHNVDQQGCCDFASIGAGFTWKYPRCLDSSGDVLGFCTGDALDGSNCGAKDECPCNSAEGCEWVEPYDEWECRAKFKSDGYTWTQNWIDDPSGNPGACCGGRVISDKSPAHHPNISAGGGGIDKSKTQFTCTTPFKEYILMPGGAPNHMGCIGVDNPTPDIRRELGEFTPEGRSVFTLIIRDCSYGGECKEGSGDVGQGHELVLYIPIDQMINCSDFRLPFDEKTGSLGNPATALTQQWYPNDVNACNDSDEQGDGEADINGSGCSRWIYDGSDGSPAPSSHRRVSPPLDFSLHKLNLQAQPFKATEEKQKRAKTLKQAMADWSAHQGCICHNGGDYPVRCPEPPRAGGNTCTMDIDHGLGFWFENDFVGDASTCEAVRGAIGGVLAGYNIPAEAWSCTDSCGDQTGYIHTWDTTLDSLIWQPALVGDSGLYSRRIDYWGDTGLYPDIAYTPYQPETSILPVSHVLNNCKGSHRGGRRGVVEFASNTSPIVIKSTNHGLKDDDFISVKGVLGNFRANVMTLAEWKAVGWQEKTGEKCDGENCDKIFNPPNACDTGKFNTAGPNGDPAPTPLNLWVVEVVDLDHFILKDCNGDDSDGTIDFASQCDDTYTCVDFLASTVEACPCRTLDSIPDVISSPQVSLITDKDTCQLYGYCKVVDGFPNSDTMMTKDDCITLAKTYTLYTGTSSNRLSPEHPPNVGSCTFGCDGRNIYAESYQHCIDQSNSNCQVNTWTNPNYHSCVTITNNVPNFDECWSQHNWAPVTTADPYSEKVMNWPSCPFTGEWTLCDQTEGLYDMSGAPIAGGTVTSCVIHETSQLRNGTDEYRLGYDHTPEILEELANDYYVDIDQTEVCPVCCDHYMPKDLVATISSISTENLNNLYCNVDCNGNRLPAVATGYKVHPGGAPGDTPYHCEELPGGGFGLGCVDGYTGGEYCCDCVSVTGNDAVIAGCFDCGKTYRFDSEWINLDELPGADDFFKACCSCACEPGDAKKPPCDKMFPTLEDFFGCNGCCGKHDGDQTECEAAGCEYTALTGSCGLKDGCGGTCGNLVCKPSSAGTCAGKYQECQMVGAGCDSSSETCNFCSSAPGCTWEDTTGMGMYQCTGTIDNSACSPLTDETTCSANAYCIWKPMIGECECTPCVGFPDSRHLKCQEEFICAGSGMEGNKGGCTDQKDGHCDGGYGMENPDSKGGKCGPPGMPGSIGDCVMPDREYQDGCPGLDIDSFDLKYNGSAWVTDWTPMGDVGKKQCKQVPYVGLCASVYCEKNGQPVIPAGGASCESVGGVIKEGCTRKPIPGADCGACAEWKVNGMDQCGSSDDDSWPTEQDNHYIRLELYCGDLAEKVRPGPRYGGLMSDEDYERSAMQLEAWITTCMYPACGPGNSPCGDPLGCTGDCSAAQDGSVSLVTSAHIPGVNCGPRSPCVGCCKFVKPTCIAQSNGTLDCAPQTEGCGVACAGACADEECGDNGMCPELSLVECHIYGSAIDHKRGPEIFEITYVDYDSPGQYSGRLLGRPVNPPQPVNPGDPPSSITCEWPVGTTVSLGTSDRLVAETGGGHPRTRREGSSTDILSLAPDYPTGAFLTRAVLPADYANDLMEIHVDDLRAFTTRSGALNRHLWNGAFGVDPYGPLPWPVAHQREGDPQALNNLYRVGVKATQAGDDPLNLDMNKVKVNGIENIYDPNGNFLYIEVTTENDHDLITGEKIILDRAECFKTQCWCTRDVPPEKTIAFVSNAAPIVVYTGQGGAGGLLEKHGLTTGDTVIVKNVYDDRRADGVPFLGNANGTWKITVVDDYKFSLDGSSGTLNPGVGDYVHASPDTDTWQKVCVDANGNAILDEDGEPAVLINGVDQAGCEAKVGIWVELEEKIESCPKECEIKGWHDVNPCDEETCKNDYGAPNCRVPEGFVNEPPKCYGCGYPGTDTDITIAVGGDKNKDDLNGSYVVRVLSSKTFSLHEEKHLHFDMLSSDSVGYDPTLSTNPAMNTSTHPTEWRNHVEATEWGHEIGVGPAVGPFTDKAIDWEGTQLAGGARWTRHGGKFYVALQNFEYQGANRPSRQGNSTMPVNLTYQLFFPNACCNNRQPPHNTKCPEECYQGGGPVVLDWIDKDQDRGYSAAIGLVITEK